MLLLPTLLAVVACGADADPPSGNDASEVVGEVCTDKVFTNGKSGFGALERACEQCVQAKCCAEVNAFKKTPPQRLSNGKFETPNDHAVCVANCAAEESVDPIECPMTHCDPDAGKAIVTAYNAIYACAEAQCVKQCHPDFVTIIGQRP